MRFSLLAAGVAVLLLAVGCSPRGEQRGAPSPAPAASHGNWATPEVRTVVRGPSLEARLTALLALQEEGALGPGVTFAVGLPDGQVVGAGTDRLFVSASAAKLYWVVAAVRFAGVEAVQPYAEPIFAFSDNAAAGDVIDLVGIDEVNRFLREDAGLLNTGLVSWSFVIDRVANGFPGPLDGDNYTTAEDAVRFLVQLANGDLLEPDATDAVLTWMTYSPRGYDGGIGFASTLSEQLPADVRPVVMHKAGWLSPADTFDGSWVLVDVGIVPLPDGGWYAVAAEASNAEDMVSAAAYLGWLSCRIYGDLTGTEMVCTAEVPWQDAWESVEEEDAPENEEAGEEEGAANEKAPR